MSNLLAHMDCMFSNLCDCDTIIRCLNEIHQKESETMEEYMLWIHEAVAVICCTYPDRIVDQGKNLTQDLQDALSFTMADLPEWEQANTSFDMLYMLAKKLEVRQPLHFHKAGLGSADTYRDWYQRYSTPTGRVAILEDEEVFLPDPEIWGA